MFQLAMLPAMGKDCNQLTSEGLGCDRVAMLSEMGEEVNGPPSEGPGCVRVAIPSEMGEEVNRPPSEGPGCVRVAIPSEMGEDVNRPPSEGPGCVRVAILLEMGKAVWASSTSCSNTWYVICRPPHQIWTCNKRRPLGLEQSAGRGWLAGQTWGIVRLAGGSEMG
jgi:hypothetical protein